MKTNLLFVLFLLLNFSFAFSQTQILQKYPKTQMPYQGGYVGYYKDFHDIIVEKNLLPCSNSQEMYQFSVLITPEAEVKFIKDFNEKGVEQNKCTYDLARQVAKFQKGWIPATVNGIKQSAIATFLIYPDDIFNRYSDGYFPIVTFPVYNSNEKDNKNFSKELKNNFDLKRFDWNNTFSVDVDFTITKEGKMEDIFLSKPTGLAEFDKMIIYGFKRMKKKWAPATVNGLPVDYRIKYSIGGVTDPVD